MTVLHVTNGDSVVGTLRQTSLGGAALSWDDVLHEGPVPAMPPEELRRVRAAYLASCGWGSADEIERSLARRDQALAAAEEAVLWFEHDLHDQLQLLQILAMAADPARLQLINVGSFEGRPDFHGLGELDADELESLWPLRRPVADGQLDVARRAWDAFRSPETAAIDELLEGDTSALPFLAAALRRLLEELPDAAGLARSERALLAPLLDGPRTPWQLFLAAQEAEEAPYAGDAWAWKRLADLDGLLMAEDGTPVPDPPPRGEAGSFASTRLVLTPAGRAVLTGAADRVQLLGIDRWLGGTHLRPDSLRRR